jgi:hypothetical protein
MRTRIWTLAVVVIALAMPRMTMADETASVEGRVNFQGKPLAGATVGFHPAKGKAVVARTDEQGRYSAAVVPAGELRVTVAVVQPKPAVPPKDAKPRKDTDKPPEKPIPPRFIAIPKKYGDPNTSGLTVTLQKGKNVFDIELK